MKTPLKIVVSVFVVVPLATLGWLLYSTPRNLAAPAPDSQWIPVPGGQHMYFGSFDGGVYREKWAAGIARDAQQAIVTTAVLKWLTERIR